MGDYRTKAVSMELADLSSRSSYILEKMQRNTENISRNEVLELPGIASLNVTADGGTLGSTPNTISNSSLTLTIDQHPAVYTYIPRLDAQMSLSGAFFKQVSSQAFMSLKNSMDETYLSATSRVAAWDTSGSYVANADGGTLAAADFLDCMGRLQDQDGSQPANFIWVLSPWAEIAVRSIASFQPNFVSDPSVVGTPQIGTLYGAPVFQTRSTLRNRAVATSAVTESGGTATATVSSGHGINVGEKITTTGLTANDADVIVSAVTATSVAYPTASGSGAYGDGVGTITSQVERSMLIDTTFSHSAIQVMPDVRIKPVAGSTTEELEVSSVFGFATREGRAINLHGPVGSL